MERKGSETKLKPNVPGLKVLHNYFSTFENKGSTRVSLLHSLSKKSAWVFFFVLPKMKSLLGSNSENQSL